MTNVARCGCRQNPVSARGACRTASNITSCKVLLVHERFRGASGVAPFARSLAPNGTHAVLDEDAHRIPPHQLDIATQCQDVSRIIPLRANPPTLSAVS